jgi:hypothetical protein
MRKLLAFGAALALASSAAAAPDVAQVTQKGSLLIFPDIRVDAPWNTLVRISNDGSNDVDVKCYWMDGNKNRVDFIIPVTRNQPVWFDANTGTGTRQVNQFPNGFANGIDNPFLVGPGATEATDTSGAYERGLLVCWAVDPQGANQVKWNHLSGTATVYSPGGAYEYNAYAFFVPSDQIAPLDPVGDGGTIQLNSTHYDSCPQYLIGQFSPAGASAPNAPSIVGNRLAIASCDLQLQQDWVPHWTKLNFDVWNEDEVKFTGAYECADSWHETTFGADIDAAAQNFDWANLGVIWYSARYRVQDGASTQCDPVATKGEKGLVGVQSTQLVFPAEWVGTTLAHAGKSPTAQITWDPQFSEVPEGGIR